MYLLNAARVQLVTVTGTINGQRIVNRFHYAYFGVLPSPDVDDSATFLTNFRLMWRANVIPVAWDDYSVVAYGLAEIESAHATPTPPIRYVTVMDPSKIDLLLGTVADKGTIASAGATKIPTHEAMRLRWNPGTRAPKRFRANYSRLSLGFATTTLAATPEQWSAGSITTYSGAFSTMATTAVFGQPFPASTGYFPSAWSPPYYANVLPLGANARDAARQFVSATVEPFVGTQITRRFFPLGGFRGI